MATEDGGRARGDAPQGTVVGLPGGTMGDAPVGAMRGTPRGTMGDGPGGTMGDAPRGALDDAPRGAVGDAPRGALGRPAGPAARGGAGRWRALPLALMALGAAAGFVLLREHAGLETLRLHRDALLALTKSHYPLAVAGYTAIYVLVVAFSLPGAFLMTLAGGFLFGAAIGTTLAVMAASIGASLVFLAARAGLGERLRAHLARQGGDGLLARIERGLRRDEVSYLILLRLVPAVPFVIANLAPAFLGVRLRTFFATTLVGILPGTLLTAWIGAGIGEVFDRGGTPAAGDLVPPELVLPVLGLAALVALPLALRRLAERRRARRAP